MNKFNNLGTVATLTMGQSPDGTSYNTNQIGLPFFQGKAEFGQIYPVPRKWCSSPIRIAEPGDILISVRAPVGPTNLAFEKCCIGRGLAAIRPIASIIDRDFLWFFIRHVEPLLIKKGQGSTFEAIGGADLASLEVPKFSLSIQRRIAAQLKAQLAAVEEARQALQAQINDAELLAQRIREETLPELVDAKRIALGDLLNGIEAGKSFQTSDRLAKDVELGVLKVSAVSWAKFQADEAKAIDGNYSPDERHRVKAGDLLISRANTMELVGAVVRVDRDYPNRLLSDKTLRLIVDEERVFPGYLLQALRLPEARTHIEGNATGTSNSMRNIGQDTIRAIPIPLPPLAIQKRIAERLNSAEITLNQLKQAIDASLKEIDLLPSRLFAEAFGET